MILLYVKIKGRVYGPFDEGKLRGMVRKGLLGRFSLVSEDGQQWKKVNSYTDLFPDKGSYYPWYRTADLEKSVAAKHSTTIGVENTAHPGDDSPDWYYGDGRSPTGPFSENELIEMVHSGKIGGNTLIWCDEMNGWKAMSKVDQFQALIQGETRSSPTSGEGSAVDAVKNKDGLNHEFTDELVSSRGWMLFVAIMLTISGVISTLSSFYFVIVGAKNNSFIIVASAFGGFVGGVIQILASVFLYKITSCIQRLRFQPDTNLQLKILKTYRHFWIFVAWTIIALLVIASLSAIIWFGAKS